MLRFLLVCVLGFVYMSGAHASVTFACKEPPGSVVQCAFVIVDPAADDLLPSDKRALETFIVKGGEQTTVADTYLGKKYCADFVTMLDQKAACYGAKSVVALNRFGGAPEQGERPYLPLDLRPESVSRCELVSSDMANRPYQYGKDGMAIWVVQTIRPGAFFDGSALVTDVEAEATERVCAGKWVIETSAEIGEEPRTFSPIADFRVPRYSEFEAFKVSTGAQVQKALLQEQTRREGYVLHVKLQSYWYVAYQELYWEAKVARTTDPDSEPVIADSLKLVWSLDDDGGTVDCGKASFCARSERKYAVDLKNIRPGFIAPGNPCVTGISILNDIPLSASTPKDVHCLGK